MTEHEYIQNILYMRELAASDLMDFIATFFAYVAMSHFFGKALTPALAVSASLIYSSWASVTFFSLAELSVSITQMGQALHSAYPQAESYISKYGGGSALPVILTVGPVFFSWLLSIFYLHGYVRRSERDPTQQGPAG